MVEGVEVVVVGHVVRDDLGVDDVALAFLADLEQGLGEKRGCVICRVKRRRSTVRRGPTWISLAVDVLGASGLVREMVYMISLVWLPASSFFHGW